MGMLMPLTIPVCLSLADSNTIWRLPSQPFSGAVFGDHCSPMTTLPSFRPYYEISPYDHFRTQLPYRYAASVATLAGLFHGPWTISGYVDRGYIVYCQFRDQDRFFFHFRLMQEKLDARSTYGTHCVMFFNSFYYPVFAVIYLDFGMTLEQFAILNSIWAATIILAEVPSGTLSILLAGRK